MRNRYSKYDSLEQIIDKGVQKLKLKQSKNYHATQHDISIDVMIVALSRKIKKIQDKQDDTLQKNV